MTAPVELPVVLQHHAVVAENPRGWGARVRDPRLGGGEFQREVIAQELSERVLDRFGFVSWPAESDQPISRIAPVSAPSIARLLGVKRRQRLPLATPSPCLRLVTREAQLLRQISEASPGRIDAPSVATGLWRDARVFDTRVEFAQVDMRHTGAQHRALRAPA
ncbi:MAG: hypothetical protein ACREOH_01920 [Candidatus Entotheonellia bacterium]